MNARHLDRVFAGLVAGTAMTWWIGERGAAGGTTMALILAIAGLKCLFVILDFMALRGVRRLWQGLVIGWVVVVLALVALAYR